MYSESRAEEKAALRLTTFHRSSPCTPFSQRTALFSPSHTFCRIPSERPYYFMLTVLPFPRKHAWDAPPNDLRCHTFLDTGQARQSQGLREVVSPLSNGKVCQVPGAKRLVGRSKGSVKAPTPSVIFVPLESTHPVCESHPFYPSQSLGVSPSVPPPLAGLDFKYFFALLQ